MSFRYEDADGPRGRSTAHETAHEEQFRSGPITEFLGFMMVIEMVVVFWAI